MPAFSALFAAASARSGRGLEGARHSRQGHARRRLSSPPASACDSACSHPIAMSSGAGNTLPNACIAIQELTQFIEQSDASTLMELAEELKAKAKAIKEGKPTSISLAAGCDLFVRHVTRTQALEFADLDEAKKKLIGRGKQFGEISLMASRRRAIVHFRGNRRGFWIPPSCPTACQICDNEPADWMATTPFRHEQRLRRLGSFSSEMGAWCSRTGCPGRAPPPSAARIINHDTTMQNSFTRPRPLSPAGGDGSAHKGGGGGEEAL